MSLVLYSMSALVETPFDALHSWVTVTQGPGAYAFKGFTSVIASALILWLSFALLKFMVRLLA